ncbi:MAG: carboxypeptidase-like regulatory domain-containing protein, partial [Saprospiraceae bacterium]|nr:carboxypeptidase-like regulatory domain-containing protein [Saprospiraceae bacterium]
MKRILLGLAMLCISAGFALGQRVVTGKVTSDQGEALIGVTVTAPGTSAGAQTDVDGNYRLSLPTTATSVKFVYTGYVDKEVTLSVSNVYDVVLEGNVSALHEVVVVGYGTQQKRA